MQARFNFLLPCLFFVFISPSSWGQEFSFAQLFSVEKELGEIALKPQYQVQIIYTQIDRKEGNQPIFSSFQHRVDSSVYFYPASTVKMPTAFLALQRLNELDIDKTTPMRIGADRFPQSAVSVDTSSINQLPSVAHYVKKIFTVSDNDAYNRLFEFLGQEYINTELKKKGFHDSRIKHRLVGGYDGEENQYINPIWFYQGDEIIYHQEGKNAAYPFAPFDKEKLIRGKGYFDDATETVVEQAFDFSEKNFISLQDLHDILQRVMFPEAFSACEQFNLTKTDYQFLHEWMNKLPNQSKSPKYSHPDNYVKFILFGDEDENFKIPDHIKIFNKVGFAYGFVTDVAYVVDKKNGVEFLLAVQILTNENEIFNDGEYEYEDIAFPFMGKLGKAIYEYERNRKRNHKPDLNKFFQ